jgi:rubrerythrin
MSQNTSGERFAASDVEYNIITTLSNLLQAEQVLRQYAQDAEEAGNSDVAAIFNDIEQSNNQFSGRLMEQLHKLIH